MPYFAFNNMAYFTSDRDEVEKIYENNKKNFGSLLKKIFSLKRISLESTKKVINDRMHIKNNIMVHSAVTSNGSSGSPLIRRNRKELNYIVGIHFGTLKDHKYYNLATSFDNILNDLKNKIIETSQIKIVRALQELR